MFPKSPALRAIIFFSGACLFSLEPSRQEAVADTYAQRALRTINQGEHEQALAFLERAQDYATGSSDLPYMLALTRETLGKNKYAILYPALLALETGRWTYCEEADARLLCARTYIHLRRYTAALSILAAAPESAAAALLRLQALTGAGAPYTEAAREALYAAQSRYPFDTAIAIFALNWLRTRGDPARDRGLATLILKRLPALREKDPGIAYAAAPFAGTDEDIRALLASQYAQSNGQPPQTALPDLLRFGVIDEAEAARLLFSAGTLDAAVIREQHSLLRTDTAREAFRARLCAYSGAITEAANAGGWPEARAEYQNGLLVSFVHDTLQDGVHFLALRAEAGMIMYAEEPAANTPAEAAAMRPAAARPPDRAGIDRVQIHYTEYPAAADIQLIRQQAGRTITFRFRPGDYSHKPVDFEDLAGPYGLPFPRFTNRNAAAVTEQSLWAAAWEAETQGGSFEDSTLVLTLKDGRIQDAKEYTAGRLASQDLFSGGLLYERHIDMDLDGLRETHLRFAGLHFDTPADYLRQFHSGAPAEHRTDN